MVFVKAYVATILSFFIIDAVWIALFVRRYYEGQVGGLLRDTPHFGAAFIFYLMYAGAIVFLTVRPALATGRLTDALVYGAVLGAVAYGTFTVTNYSVLNGWTLGLVVSDIAWGTFLTSIVAACGYLAARW